MGVGDFLSSRAERVQNTNRVMQEAKKYEDDPSLLKEHLITHYVDKGMSSADARNLHRIFRRVQTVTGRSFVVRMMLLEKGFLRGEDDDDPQANQDHFWRQDEFKDGFVTFVSFLFFGAIPISAYYLAPFIEVDHLLFTSVLTAIELILLGYLKARMELFEVSWKRVFFSTLPVPIYGLVACGFSWLIAVQLKSHALNVTVS